MRNDARRRWCRPRRWAGELPSFFGTFAAFGGAVLSCHRKCAKRRNCPPACRTLILLARFHVFCERFCDLAVRAMPTPPRFQPSRPGPAKSRGGFQPLARGWPLRRATPGIAFACSQRPPCRSDDLHRRYSSAQAEHHSGRSLQACFADGCRKNGSSPTKVTLTRLPPRRWFARAASLAQIIKQQQSPITQYNVYSGTLQEENWANGQESVPLPPKMRSRPALLPDALQPLQIMVSGGATIGGFASPPRMVTSAGIRKADSRHPCGCGQPVGPSRRGSAARSCD